MPLTSEQFTFIESVDTQIKLLLQHGAHEEQVLIEMLPHMLAFKNLLKEVSISALDTYYANYDGFHYYSLLLGRLDQNIVSGHVALPPAWDLR